MIKQGVLYGVAVIDKSLPGTYPARISSQASPCRPNMVTCFQKNKIATVKTPISRRQNGHPQAKGWRHGGSFYYLSYSLWTVVIFTIKGTLLNFWPLVVLWSNFIIFFVCLYPVDTFTFYHTTLTAANKGREEAVCKLTDIDVSIKNVKNWL